MGGSGGPRCSECRSVEVWTQGFQKYITLGLWWIVPEIWFWGFGGPWGALGGRDDKVMVQVVIYMSCTTKFIV